MGVAVCRVGVFVATRTRLIVLLQLLPATAIHARLELHLNAGDARELAVEYVLLAKDIRV